MGDLGRRGALPGMITNAILSVYFTFSTYVRSEDKRHLKVMVLKFREATQKEASKDEKAPAEKR